MRTSSIYENVKRDAADELARPAAALGFSGLFAGATVGFARSHRRRRWRRSPDITVRS